VQIERPKILIVDDEVSIRTALERWFNIRGFEVDQAADGMEALEKCRANRYDVITMDLEMPRMGGLEAMAALREYLPNVPVVVLTGFTREGDSAKMLGAAKVLTKPLRLGELERHVRELIHA